MSELTYLTTCRLCQKTFATPPLAPHLGDAAGRGVMEELTRHIAKRHPEQLGPVVLAVGMMQTALTMSCFQGQDPGFDTLVQYLRSQAAKTVRANHVSDATIRAKLKEIWQIPSDPYILKLLNNTESMVCELRDILEECGPFERKAPLPVA